MVAPNNNQKYLPSTLEPLHVAYSLWESSCTYDGLSSRGSLRRMIYCYRIARHFRGLNFRTLRGSMTNLENFVLQNFTLEHFLPHVAHRIRSAVVTPRACTRGNVIGLSICCRCHAYQPHPPQTIQAWLEHCVQREWLRRVLYVKLLVARLTWVRELMPAYGL